MLSSLIIHCHEQQQLSAVIATQGKVVLCPHTDYSVLPNQLSNAFRDYQKPDEMDVLCFLSERSESPITLFWSRKIIIDTDPGLDDAQAILMALSNNSVDVVAITTVQGNCPVDSSCRNALRLLKVAGRLDIPVFRGCEHPILEQSLHATHHHGDDGFGDFPDSEAPTLDLAQKEHAVMGLIRLVNENPGEITLVTLGPLTNIAMAIRLEPKFGTKLKSCYTMGGNYRGIGNASRTSEFNFCNDPEAAQIFLTKLSCPITIATWELCTDMKQPLSLLDKIFSLPGKKAGLIQNIFKKKVRNLRETSGHYVMCDELAMAAILDEQTVLDTIEVHAEMELHGSITRGQMVPDIGKRAGKPDNVRIITKMDMKLIENILLNAYNV